MQDTTRNIIERELITLRKRRTELDAKVAEIETQMANVKLEQASVDLRIRELTKDQEA